MKHILSSLCLILILSFFHIPAQAQKPTPTPVRRGTGTPEVAPTKVPNGWSNPLLISPETGSAWFPDLVADATGRIHVAWAGGTVGYDAVIYTSSKDGKIWNPVNDVAVIPQVKLNESDATRPALWIDKEGYLNLTYGTSNAYFTRAHTSIANAASAWTEPVKLNIQNPPYFVRFLEDEQGTLHLVFTENLPSNLCALCYHVFYRNSSDHGATWSEAVDISRLTTGSAKAQIITDRQGTLFVVWEAGIGGSYGSVSDPSEAYFTASYDRGKTWSKPLKIHPDSIENAKNITIELGSDGDLVAAYMTLPENKVKYQVSRNKGRTWSKPEDLQDIWGGWDVYRTQKDTFSMSVDSAGNIHLILVGKLTEEQKELEVMHLTWFSAENAWSAPEIIAKLDEDVPEWPRLTMSEGNILNAIWFIRQKDTIWQSDIQQYQIYYARKKVDAPAIATVPEVIPTAAVSAASLPNPAQETPSPASVAATPIPTFAASAPSTGVIVTENDYLKVIGLAIAPVLLLLALVSLIVLRKRIF